MKIFVSKASLHFFSCLLFGFLFSNMACVTTSRPVEQQLYEGMEPPIGNYSMILDKWTSQDRAYTDIAETFQVSATLLSEDLTEFQIYRDANNYHWTADEYRDHLQQGRSDMATKTKIFLAFYTGSDAVNNLDKSNSAWNIILKVHGQRYVPSEIKKNYENIAKLADKYPFVTVWSTQYDMTFNLPTQEAQADDSELIIAGPVGSIHLHFPRRH